MRVEGGSLSYDSFLQQTKYKLLINFIYWYWESKMYLQETEWTMRENDKPTGMSWIINSKRHGM